MSNLAANECFEEEGFVARQYPGWPAAAEGMRDMPDPGQTARAAADWIAEGICRLAHQAQNLVVVTLNVFGDLTAVSSLDPGTRLYLQCLGEVNRQMAQMADEVTEVVYGIPVPLKMRPDQECHSCRKSLNG